MKKLFCIVGILWMAAGVCCGCSVTDMEEENKKSVEYKVVANEDIPQELMSLIEEKLKQEFQITYQDGEDLYLIRGYGRQERGGYSIQVEEVSVGEKAFLCRTSLIGPSKEEQEISEPSYPYIVLRTRYHDLPVQFE